MVSVPSWFPRFAVSRLLSQGEIEDGVGLKDRGGWLRHRPPVELEPLVGGLLYLRQGIEIILDVRCAHTHPLFQGSHRGAPGQVDLAAVAEPLGQASTAFDERDR